MPAPLAYGAGLAVGKALPFISKHLISILLGGGYLASKGIEEVGRAGERKLTKEQMRLQSLLTESSAEAAKRAAKESRVRAKEYTEQLLKAKREESKQRREEVAMESFVRSQDRQMALVLQAVQALSARPMGASTQGPGGGGMLGLMRGGF